MLKQFISFALLLSALTAGAQQAMQVWQNGKFVLFPITSVDSVRFVCLVTNIYLSQEAIELKTGETKQLTATVYPIDADDKAVVWSSSTPSVASVNANGLVTTVSAGTSVITASATDGSGVKAECQVIVKTDDNSGTLNGRDYVDLGLPSGTLWATCNVGANSPEEYGDYFAWGEIESKSKYDWSTYKWCNGSKNTITKYCKSYSYGMWDNKTELEPADDAATANWGSGWQMPSLAQCEELLYGYTTTTWTTQNGVYGRKITSKSNGNNIFLPAAGYRYDSSLSDGVRGSDYWSRSLDTDYCYCGREILLSSTTMYTHRNSRYYGCSVRPVRVQN